MPAGSLLFINLSPAGLAHPSLEGRELLGAVRAAGLTPQRVVFELTEPSTVDAHAVASGAKSLIALGFQIALDNLGAGRSSTEWVGLVPAHFLKLDPALLLAARSDPISQALLQGFCTIAHQTGATVIAEGVEDPETLELLPTLPGPPLPRLRIEAAQGFGLGALRPRPTTLESTAGEHAVL